ncbi:MAG: hypothetical protein V3T64_03120 [Myxococcota bacterium]
MGKLRKVGEILLQAGIIDETQLELALAEQQQWGCRIGPTLIKLGMVEEKDLIRALAMQFDLPVASLAGKRIPPEAIALVPARVATEHSVIPLFVKRDGKAGKIFLGMEDPSDVEVLDDLCFRTGLEIQPVMVGPTDLGAAIDRYYLHKQEHSGATALAASTESMGERSLSFSKAEPKSEPEPISGDSPSLEISMTQAVVSEAEQPASRDNELSFQQHFPVLPDGLVQDLERVVAESEKTRGVLIAITELLVEEGIRSLDQIQSRIAKLKGDDSEA